MPGKKRKLPPALQANADKLKKGEKIGGKKSSSKKTTRKTK